MAAARFRPAARVIAAPRGDMKRTPDTRFALLSRKEAQLRV
jgi:hypothetical protein